MALTKEKKEDSNGLRAVVIKHFLNEDSEGEIARKVLISRTSVRCMIAKHKSMNCIGRDRKWKTTIYADRLIECQIKTNHHHL